MRVYDLTYGEFNPRILYAYKRKAMKNGDYHSHKDYMEITYILSGHCKYIVEGKEYDLYGGDLLVTKARVQHQHIYLGPKEAAVEFYAGFRNFHFRGMQPNEIQLKDGGYIMHCEGKLKERLNQLCCQMDEEHQEMKMGKYLMINAFLMQMLILIARENIDEPEPIQDGYVFRYNNRSYIVKKIISYLNENYAEKISLDQIAKNMYLSPVYISKLFKEETGESPINYLINIRLEKARDMLKNEECGSIRSVAEAVGYDDVYYFSKLFKKYYGEAPLYFRKNWMQES